MWDFFRKAFDVLAKVIGLGFNAISTSMTWIVGFITVYLVTPAKTFWTWVGDMFDSVLNAYPKIQELLEKLHVSEIGDYWADSSLAQAVSVASNWFPFDFALACFTGLVILWIFCLVFKLLRKSIFFFVGG